MTTAFPVSSIDPFADDFLAAPYPFHAELREAGPVVWLEAEMITTALATRVARIDIVGKPRRKLSNSLRQFASLPIELTPG